MVKVVVACGDGSVRRNFKECLDKVDGIELAAIITELAHENPKDVQTNSYLRDVLVIEGTAVVPIKKGVFNRAKERFCCRSCVVAIKPRHIDGLSIAEVFRCGAEGVITSQPTPQDLQNAIFSVSNSLKYLSPCCTDVFVNWVLKELKYDGHKRERRMRLPLTADEKELLDRLCCGIPLQKIANELGISLRTVQRRKRDLMERFEVKTLSELIKKRSKFLIL